ncbi:MAG: aminotransferase class V-fold PLP-dependent enzyme [Cytophagales bacterium]|nr:aminotransferase class V-fold PLP-dependent enzyme [Cytophagales bacterium]
MDNRRKFLKSSLLGMAAASALPFETFGAKLKSEMPKCNVDEDQEAYWSLIRSLFDMAPSLRYFNHASLGTSPRTVRRATSEFMETLDQFPSKYMWGGWEDQKEAVRAKIATLFGASKEEIALNHNTSEGMNLIAKSFDFKSGDEVILGDHEHASGTIPWQFWQETKGIKLVRPTLPLLPESKEDIVDVYRKAITSKTKVISMCHVVNTNGMVLPVKEVSEMAREKGVLVAVDGAQGAGMFQFDLHDLGCDFYTASAHKWMFAPKEVGFFYAREESQHHLKPLMVARGHKNLTIRRLETYNTRNLPGVLGLGAALDFINEIGISRINDRSYELKAYFRDRLKDNSKFKLKSPASDDVSCAIQSVEIIGKSVGEAKNELFEQFGIDCRPMSGFGLNALRISMPVYITKADIDYLVEALEAVAIA